MYSDWIKKNPADDGVWGLWPRCRDEMKIDEKTVADAAKRSSRAVVAIGRSAGEDRENTLKKGSYYLTDDETALLDKVTANFKNTVVLINSGNIIDMSWMNKYGDKLGAVLYVWQGGMESGNAVGEVLSGKASPSGKLPDTIADCYESYPAAENFGKKLYNNYAEDIFVGYRYFETFAPEKVMFPFGFGLSYTSFELSDKLGMSALPRAKRSWRSITVRRRASSARRQRALPHMKKRVLFCRVRSREWSCRSRAPIWRHSMTPANPARRSAMCSKRGIIPSMPAPMCAPASR